MGKESVGLGSNVRTMPIEGTNGKYVAGSDGHIYCYSSARNNFHKPHPFQVSEHVGSNDYLFLALCEGSRRKSKLVHSLVCAAFHGAKPSPFLTTLHHDGEKTNNRPDNLRWGTYAENEADKKRHGRVACGEKQGSVKLTEEVVRIIRASIPLGLWNTVDASKVFGVSAHYISRIARGEGWEHIK